MTSSVPSPILDYASPGSRPKLALPTQSVLTLYSDADCVLITERLEAKAGAAGAILFTLALFVWWAVLLATVRHIAAVIVPLWVLQLALLVKVIYDTFRTTKLEAYPDRLHLTLTAPFRHRSYIWPLTELSSITPTPARGHAVPTLGTLILTLTTGQTIHLFAGHPFTDHITITSHLNRILNRTSEFP